MDDARRFSIRVRVYYEDTDAGGIVYHATYLRWMERARTDWLRTLGERHVELAESAGVQFVVSEIAIRYRRPARLDDLLDVDLEVAELRRASMRLVQRTRPAGGGEAIADADVRVAVMDRRTGRPAGLPRRLLDTLGAP
ncbi:MAG: tol-pal system-associated acyl-CoA thioesterase [Burkholderiaceae bacterium]|jgi:acyl-CoA thioester hydrolase|nr:tol-pal system-associated acyl-CoA thioesterase [Burkholderiales bacterium]MCZ8341151.1 tol-pal system-associated acyl-CoA thioesterase [Burkholderiaceae bacterium]